MKTADDDRSHRTWTDDQRLTWEEFVAGQPCKVCGVGWLGGPALVGELCLMERDALADMRGGAVDPRGRLFPTHIKNLVSSGLADLDNNGDLHITSLGESELLEADRESERFLSRHSDCDAIRHGVTGGGYTHCGKCCPPPPMSPEQARRVMALLFEMVQRHEADEPSPAEEPPATEEPKPPKPPTPQRVRQLEKMIARRERELGQLREELRQREE